MDVESAWEGTVDRKQDHENLAWGVKKDKSGNICLKFEWVWMAESLVFHLFWVFSTEKVLKTRKVIQLKG